MNKGRFFLPVTTLERRLSQTHLLCQRCIGLCRVVASASLNLHRESQNLKNRKGKILMLETGTAIFNVLLQTVVVQYHIL